MADATAARMHAEGIEDEHLLAHGAAMPRGDRRVLPLGIDDDDRCAARCSSACTITVAPLPLRVGPMVQRWRLSV